MQTVVIFIVVHPKKELTKRLRLLQNPKVQPIPTKNFLKIEPITISLLHTKNRQIKTPFSLVHSVKRYQKRLASNDVLAKVSFLPERDLNGTLVL